MLKNPQLFSSLRYQKAVIYVVKSKCKDVPVYVTEAYREGEERR